MAGVIDENGIQWERCNCCGRFVRLEDDMGYEYPSAKHPYGRDLCVNCVDAGIRNGSIEFDTIRPASSWQTYEVENG